MKEEKIRRITNMIYLIILILILLILFIISFKTGENFYQHTSDLNNQNDASNTHVATWNFEVRLEY